MRGERSRLALRGRISALVLLVALGTMLAACGSTPAHARARVTVELQLERVLLALGGSTRGTLTVHNPGPAFVVRSCPTDGTFTVGLSSAAIPYRPLSGAVLCSMRFPRGVTVLRVTVSARYQRCGGRGVPACIRGPEPTPPLPRGLYVTSVGWAGVPSFVVRPAAIEVGVGVAVPV